MLKIQTPQELGYVALRKLSLLEVLQAAVEKAAKSGAWILEFDPTKADDKDPDYRDAFALLEDSGWLPVHPDFRGNDKILRFVPAGHRMLDPR